MIIQDHRRRHHRRDRHRDHRRDRHRRGLDEIRLDCTALRTDGTGGSN